MEKQLGRFPFEVGRDNLVRIDNAQTDPRYGCHPSERTLKVHLANGVINVDKPRGPTSHQVCAWIKEIFNIKKAGHGGTLDPKVSGVLPVALDDATKVVQTLLTGGKEYVTIMQLHNDVDFDKLTEAVEGYEGEITQLPPLRSAVARRERTRTIYYIDLLEVYKKLVLLRVGCQAGTYIRKLCHDLGQTLGTGAHMAELRRSQTGPFFVKNSVPLQDVVDAVAFYKEDEDESALRKIVQPVEFAASHLPSVTIIDTAVSAISHGAHLALPGVAQLQSKIEVGDLVTIMSLKGELVALGIAQMTSEDMIMQKRGICVKTERVFMPRNTYPKMWKRDTSGN